MRPDEIRSVVGSFLEEAREELPFDSLPVTGNLEEGFRSIHVSIIDNDAHWYRYSNSNVEFEFEVPVKGTVDISSVPEEYRPAITKTVDALQSIGYDVKIEG